jgi:hypothetical protein
MSLPRVGFVLCIVWMVDMLEIWIYFEYIYFDLLTYMNKEFIPPKSSNQAWEHERNNSSLYLSLS